MANTIGRTKDSPQEEWLSFSNGATDLFLAVLGLSGSRLAQTQGEKRLIVWLLERDQSVLGAGTVGFDLCEMPWEIPHLQEQISFLMRVLDGVEAHLGWECLDFTPNLDFVRVGTEKFRKMLSRLKTKDLTPNALSLWLEAMEESDPVFHGFPKCPKHGIFLTVWGCYLCNRESENH